MDVLTVEEVAQRLKLNPFTIRRLLREGALRGIKVGKRQWRVQLHDLEAYLGQRNNGIERVSQHRANAAGTAITVETMSPQGRQPYPQDFVNIEPADLDALLAGVTPENRHDLADWGAPVGNEVW